MCAVLRAHRARGESHVQRNADGEVATVHSPMKNNNCSPTLLCLFPSKNSAAQIGEILILH